MNYAEICIIKRDGKREDFSISKIKNAIGKAFHASGIDNEDKLIAEITMRVISNFVSNHQCGRDSGSGRKGTDESTSRSGQEIYYLSRMAEYGTRP